MFFGLSWSEIHALTTENLRCQHSKPDSSCALPRLIFSERICTLNKQAKLCVARRLADREEDAVIDPCQANYAATINKVLLSSVLISRLIDFAVRETVNYLWQVRGKQIALFIERTSLVVVHHQMRNVMHIIKKSHCKTVIAEPNLDLKRIVSPFESAFYTSRFEMGKVDVLLADLQRRPVTPLFFRQSVAHP